MDNNSTIQNVKKILETNAVTTLSMNEVVDST